MCLIVGLFFLNEEDKIVAYWIFVALKEDAYHLVSSGRVDEKDISIEDIRFIDMPGNYKGYLLLSGAIEHCRIPKVVNKLYDSWIKYIEKMAKQEIFLMKYLPWLVQEQETVLCTILE